MKKGRYNAIGQRSEEQPKGTFIHEGVGTHKYEFYIPKILIS